MRPLLKDLIVCLILLILLPVVTSPPITQADFEFSSLWDNPSSMIQPFQVTTREKTFNGKGNILVDNFEYMDSPFNYGWEYPVSAYPDYASGNYLLPSTAIDLTQGSQVLDWPGGCFSGFAGCTKGFFSLDPEFKIYHSLSGPSYTDPDLKINYINLDTHPVISFDLRLHPGFKPFNTFELSIVGETAGGNNVNVKIVPQTPPDEACLGQKNSTPGMSGIYIVTDFDTSVLEVTVVVDRCLLDLLWHSVWIDLVESVKIALDGFNSIPETQKPNWYITKANTIILNGESFKLDNIMFRSNYNHKLIDSPDLFEMGPLYAQIFEPYRYLFVADYKGIGITAFDKKGQAGEINQITDLMLNPDNFLLVQDPNDPNDPVVRYWTDEMGADPKLFGENDPNIAEIFNRDSFVVDLTLPIFADSDLRMGPDGPGSLAKTIINSGTLYWNYTVSGYGANVVDPCGILQPLPVYPYDGMPTYLPARYSVIDVIKTYDRPYYSPEHVYLLEGALWNSGITVWPNIATLNFTPQYFEDLIVTLKVTNGVDYDVRTFPISVVNYPVENYPPVLQLDIRDQVFYVDEFNEYAVNLIDPDCFIFSMSTVPPSTHVPGFPVSEDYRTDMDELYWEIKAITINGQVHTLPYVYCNFGPWCGCGIFSSLMDGFDYCHFQHTGLIQFTPQSEKNLEIAIYIADSKGGSCFSELKIICMPWSDTDEDSIHDSLDNCPFLSNPSQLDSDEDDIGDECDTCPEIPGPNQDDLDSDGIGDLCDNCPGIPNTDQLDDDKDNKGDVCDPCPSDPNDDADGDGWCGNIDNCPHIWNPDQEDTDSDGLGNACDNCPEYSNPDQKNSDGDGIGDICDNCPYFSNPNQQDTDGDRTGDECDTCPEIPDPNQDDQDGDGIGDLCDNCIGTPNPFQVDLDQDGIGHYCDLCPNDSNNDIDGDGICGNKDNCPNISNPDQADSDGDNIGDACESSSSSTDRRQSKYTWPYYQFWPQIPGLLGFMPYSFPGYQPGFIYSSLFSNTQIPFILKIPQRKYIYTTNYGFSFLPSPWTSPYSETWPSFISSYEQNIFPIGFSQYLP